MKNHPGHFWICLWMFAVIMFIGSEIGDLRKAVVSAIEANTAAVKELRR